MQLHLIVHGRVQGVCFRSEAKELADKLGINGWVRNLPSGSVEVLVQGKKSELETLRQWCQHGPTLARVDQVEEIWQEQKEKFTDFSVAL